MAGFWLPLALVRGGVGGAKGCAVCGCLPRAGRVNGRLNCAEGLAVASRRSGEGLGAELEADG